MRQSTPRARRVLVLNWRDLWHPEGGGSELYVEQVARRLAAAGTEVTVFTARYPGAPARARTRGVEYVRRGGHLTVYLWAAWLLLTRRFGRLDAVLEVQNGMPFLARLWAPRTPVVVLVHHVHREQWPVVGPVLSRVGWFLESRVAVRVNRGAPYVAVSQVTRQELVELGVRAYDVHVVYNGLPEPPDHPLPEAAEEPTLAVLSRLVPHKQVEHALRATAALAGEFPGLRLRVMGSGWWESHLLPLAAELGIADRVDFLGHVSDEQKYAELARAWVHVLPSLKEGWGLSIVEAASVGVPSVAYADAGGVTESILDGVTGLLARDEQDLVDLVGHLLRRSDLRRSLGQKAQVRAAQFTWDATAARIGGLLADASGRRPHSSA